MGVPAFFRWLSRKYPSVIAPCVEEKGKGFDGKPVVIDWSQPNPNGVEFDNLYLDMNGIIHPCTHPEDKPAPKNEDEMMIAIFECIDRLLSIVRPRKLLYMAIDGVAPRAKMNQQRSRRFRASKEAVEKVNDINRIRSELLLKGAHLPPEKSKEEHFDSNCITPGTPFMARLSECLKYYIYERLNNHPGWQGIKVILSDANVPGEGEHKIMDYIRKQRAQPDHDPNTRHCLCGADADLIMLGLATHEPNFTIIREEFKPNQARPCDLCGQIGHELKDCIGVERSSSIEQETKIYGSEVEYIFVRLNVLREYLERELAMPNLPFQYDFDRVLDDWVFMCFFVGNDFLPHLPSLEIREGAIDRLVSLYKDAVYKTGGFLTENGDVNLERVQLIMNELGKAEDIIFKTRQQKELQFKARETAKRRRTEEFDRRKRPDWSLLQNTQFAPTPLGQSRTISNPRQEAYQIRKAGMHSQTEVQLQSTNTKKALEAMIRSPESDSNAKGVKRTHDEAVDNDEEAHDEVRLWEDGFKERYYESKFDIGSDNLEFRNAVALHYVRGLCWVLRYYYQGCASWKWYFPYHYAPFASDFINISGLSTEFETGTKPFEPLQQLMGVFPAASSKHVPSPWAKLMSDPDSPIIDFYPEDFKIDLNGKKFAWQGVALLPFVEEKRLFKAVEPYYQYLTPEEVKRNIRGDDVLFVSTKTKGYEIVQGLYQEKVNATEVPICFDGMTGTILLSEDCVPLNGNYTSPVKGLTTIYDNKIYSVKYRDPKYREGFIFVAKKLKGAKLPPRVLKPQDLDEQTNRNWRPQIGMAPSTTRATLGLSGHRMINHHTPQQSNSRSFSNSYRGSNYSNTYSDSNYTQAYRQSNYQRGNQSYSHQQEMTSYNQRQYNTSSSNPSAYNNYREYSHSQSQESNSQHQNYRRPGGPYRDRYEPYNPNRPYRR